MATHNGTNGAVMNKSEDTLIVGQSANGVGIQASLLRMTRNMAAFEISNPTLSLRTSEVINDFKIVIRDRTIYSGRAVVRNLVNAGLTTVCNVALEEKAWVDFKFSPDMLHDGRLDAEFRNFLESWQKLYRIDPEFKIVIADMQAYLTDLRFWMEQLELEIRSSPSISRTDLEQEVIDRLADSVVDSIDSFIDRFESIACVLDPQAEPAHREYLRRQWHPLLLSSPFAYRAYQKPLGYAGDYEMVSMMLRTPYEGSTLFAKMLNVWLLKQVPAQAHRNRVTYLKRRLTDEALRVARSGRKLRVFNLGCGPAEEVHQILRDGHFKGQIEFVLLDFNEETLESLRQSLSGLKNLSSADIPIRLVKKSIQQLLKETSRSIMRSPEDQFDFVYCAGLFDYVPDPTCKRLMNVLYEMLAPDGLLLATNVSDVMNSSRPFRYSMEYILDWYLIYRDREALARLTPDGVATENVSIVAEDTGVNVFIEVRKPKHA